MDQSPLARLPEKAKIRIYGLTLQRSEKLLFYVKDGQVLLLQNGMHRNQLALAKVCKVISADALAIFYGKNTFLLSTQAFDDVWRRRNSRILQQHDSRCSENELNTFQSKQDQWTSGLKQWLEDIGPVNAGHLRRLQISLGIWHLQKPVEYDGLVALALSKSLQILRTNKTACTVSMRISIPNPSNMPSVVDLILPITQTARASQVLKSLFDGKFDQLYRLWSQSTISGTAYKILKSDTSACQKRLQRFIQVIEGPPPRWTKRDSKALETLLMDTLRSSEQLNIDDKAGEDAEWATISSNTGEEKDTIDDTSIITSNEKDTIDDTSTITSNGKDAITDTSHFIESGDMTPLLLADSSSDLNSNLNSDAYITCVRETFVAREPKNRQYAVMPPPISLRNIAWMAPEILEGENITTVSGPLTPGGRSPSSTKHYSKSEAALRTTSRASSIRSPRSPRLKISPSKLKDLATDVVFAVAGMDGWMVASDETT